MFFLIYLLLFLLYLYNDFFFFFFFKHPPPTNIYTSSHTLSLHDALPISHRICLSALGPARTSASAATRSRRTGRSEEHTSELQSRELISYAVFCLKKKKTKKDSLSSSITLTQKKK